MKKILIKTAKGILLWVTILSWLLLIGGADSIKDEIYFIPWIVLNIYLWYLCNKYLTFHEVCTLSGYKLWCRFTRKFIDDF